LKGRNGSALKVAVAVILLAFVSPLFIGGASATNYSYGLPAVVILQPIQGAVIDSPTVNVTWVVHDLFLPTILVKLDDGAWIEILPGRDYHVFTSLSEGNHRVYVKAVGEISNTSDMVGFTIDPTVSLATRSPEGTGISVDTAISATFTEEMNISDTRMTLNDEPVFLAWVGNTATHYPPEQLAHNTTYVVEIDGNTTAGESMYEAWSFTTVGYGTVCGVVEGPGGIKLVNATVTLSNGMNTKVRENGTFQFDEVAPGNYTLNITMDGYAPVSVMVKVGEGQLVDVGTKTLQVIDEGIDGSIPMETQYLIMGVIIFIAAVLLIYMYSNSRRPKAP
jgi:hypothetical protein